MQTFQSHPGVQFLKQKRLFTLYDIFNVKATQGIEFSAFFDILQQVAEETRYMSLDENLDDFVPLVIVQQFARDFIKGFSKLMRQIGFAKVKKPKLPAEKEASAEN